MAGTAEARAKRAHHILHSSARILCKVREIKESNFVWRYVTYVRNVGSGVFSSGTKAYPVP